MVTVGITIGDPAGIGPEIVGKAVRSQAVRDACRPLVIGDRRAVPDIDPALVVDCSLLPPEGVRPGRLSAAAGAAAVGYLRRAVDMALAGEVDAICTAPLNKEAMRLAGFPWPGQTEMLAEWTGVKRSTILLVASTLRVIHVSTHVSLRQAIDMVRKERVLETIRLAHAAVQAFGLNRPRVAVAGLNPHAGEHGLFGSEDGEEIAPAVAAARAEGIDAAGPVSPDIVFHQAAQRRYDVVVAMYHDQGHIPVKCAGFAAGVNVTAGLPIVRTSPDHGTAFDIAGQGIADPSSMVEAIRVAARLAGRRPS